MSIETVSAMPSNSWATKARQRLQTFADNAFANWCETNAGQKWKSKRCAKKGQPSPYAMGFSLPDFHHDAIVALNRGDEETVKHLILTHYI